MADEQFNYELCRRYVELYRPDLVPKPCTDEIAYFVVDPTSAVRLALVIAYVTGPLPGVFDIVDYVSQGFAHA